MTARKSATATPSSRATSQAGRPDAASLIDKEAHRRNLQDAQRALAAEFQTLIGDTERLLSHTAEVAGDQASELREKIGANIARARELLKEKELSVEEQGRAAIEATEAHIHSHPWQSVGIAAGVGFLLGLLAGRR